MGIFTGKFGEFARRFGGATTVPLAVVSAVTATTTGTAIAGQEAQVQNMSLQQILEALDAHEIALKDVDKEYGDTAGAAIETMQKYRRMFPGDARRLRALLEFAQTVVGAISNVEVDASEEKHGAAARKQEAGRIIREKSQEYTNPHRGKIDPAREAIGIGGRIFGAGMEAEGYAKEQEAYAEKWIKEGGYRNALNSLQNNFEQISREDAAAREAFDRWYDAQARDGNAVGQWGVENYIATQGRKFAKVLIPYVNAEYHYDVPEDLLSGGQQAVTNNSGSYRTYAVPRENSGLESPLSDENTILRNGFENDLSVQANIDAGLYTSTDVANALNKFATIGYDENRMEKLTYKPGEEMYHAIISDFIAYRAEKQKEKDGAQVDGQQTSEKSWATHVRDSSSRSKQIT